MSFNPRKTPCMAKDKRTAGAPRDLKVRYWLAGVIIGSSYSKERTFYLECKTYNKEVT